jgi:hypothetical protein
VNRLTSEAVLGRGRSIAGSAETVTKVVFCLPQAMHVENQKVAKFDNGSKVQNEPNDRFTG